MPPRNRTRTRSTTTEELEARRGFVSPRRAGKPPDEAGLSGPGAFSDFIYNGGPVINTPQVHILFVGDWSSTANQNRLGRLTQFVSDLLSSRYMNILTQYGCGTNGTVASTTTVAAPNSSLSATDIHNLIQNAINGNKIPEPTNQATCVLLYLDNATAVHDTGAGAVMCEATSDTAFGYHDHFVTTAGNTYPFAVVPGLTDTCLKNSCSSDSTCSLHLSETQEQRQTQVSSHELSEMFSDPQVGSNEAWTRPGNPHENGDICNGESATITVGPNTWTVQKMYSKYDDMNSNGATTCITDSDPLPSLLPACTIDLDRSTFGKDEVDALLHVSDPAHVEAAFYVVADGFTPADLNITAASLTGTPNVSPNVTLTPAVTGMTVDATSLVAEDPGLSGAIQRFTWVYRVNFTSSGGFPATVGGITVVTLSATISRSTAPAVNATGNALVQLVHEPNPYEIDGPISWLSTDLRVFQLPAAGSKFSATMGATAASAPTFIQQVIANLNSGNTGGQTFDNNLSTDENASAIELSEKVNGTSIFNFAVARVRYRSLSADISNVRVFFRMFPVATTSTSYNQTTAYRRGGQGGVVIPLLGINGTEISTIPFFASPRVDVTSQGMDAQTDTPNVQPMAHDSTGGEVTAYFGAWLDINQPSQPQFPLTPSPTDGPYTGGGLQTIQQLIRGAHQCLVSEIAFDPDPIPAGSTPGSSDKLAQRNLAIVGAANPGTQASHTISHTFELARSPEAAGSSPNELLIDWRALPTDSTATLYMPGTSASAIKKAADERYVSHHLTVVDQHTLASPARGITYLPIPPGVGPNLPGLLTVALPEGIRHGQAFKVVVRELTDAFAVLLQSPVNSPTRRTAPSSAEGEGLLTWRQVTGSYQISIPVLTKDVLLLPEERLLAVLRWILEAIPASNRWYPAFKQYVNQVAERVRALGGNPDVIKPSPSGDVPGKVERVPCRTGKVCEIVFDCFGDFEAFLLVDCERRWVYKCHEPGIAALVMQAARERLTITVCANEQHESRIEKIIVRG